MRREKVRVISFLCGFALAAVGFGALAAIRADETAEREQAAQLRAFCDAARYLEAMADSLALAAVGDNPLPALAEVRHDADLAAAALGNARFSGAGGEALRRFAACTAEISGSMVDALARGQTQTPDYGLLIRLRDFSLPLRDGLLERVFPEGSTEADEALLAKHFSGLGRLYYDGVGSDVQAAGSYASLLELPLLAEHEARAAAQKIAGETARLRRLETAGEPERYCFGCSNLSVTLSARGGVLLSLLYDRQGREGDVGEDAAREAACSTLSSYGPKEAMTEVAGYAGEGVYYFSFAPLREGLLCLSERILVGVDAASGKLSFWDADRYYRYHTDLRSLPGGMLSPEEAAYSVGRGEGAVLCTAVRADGRELLCYRVGEVFLNAQTGRVERVE